MSDSLIEPDVWNHNKLDSMSWHLSFAWKISGMDRYKKDLSNTNHSFLCLDSGAIFDINKALKKGRN